MAGTLSFSSMRTVSSACRYYPVGVAMVDLWNRNISGISFSAHETAGGVANVNLMNSSEIEVDIANESLAWGAGQNNEPIEVWTVLTQGAEAVDILCLWRREPASC